MRLEVDGGHGGDQSGDGVLGDGGVGFHVDLSGVALED